MEQTKKILFGPFLLLILIYLIWLVRYPVFWLFEFVEPLFIALILSYLAVLLFSVLFLKKGAKRSLLEVFKFDNKNSIFVGIAFAVAFQTLWILSNLAIGQISFLSSLSIRGYESYSIGSFPLAFSLYVIFAVFGAFVEEVTFRGYIQSKVTIGYGCAIGILIASLFFSFQHIHIFNLNWIERFFEVQFIYVFCFGIFVGYLFEKNGRSVWGVFAFHGTMNVFNISLPVQISNVFPFASHILTVLNFTVLILILRLSLSNYED